MIKQTEVKVTDFLIDRCGNLKVKLSVKVSGHFTVETDYFCPPLD